jgi:3-isopropylmalate dehydratase small subunit
MLDSYHNKVYTSHTVAKMVGPDSDYAKYIAEYSAIKRANGNVTELVELCAKYGNVVHVDAVKNKIQNAKDALYKKYPLLKHMNSSVDNGDLAHYIKLVDKQEK